LMPYRFQFEPNANKIRKDFVYARIWTQIARTINGHINHLCSATALLSFFIFSVILFIFYTSFYLVAFCSFIFCLSNKGNFISILCVKSTLPLFITLSLPSLSEPCVKLCHSNLLSRQENLFSGKVDGFKCAVDHQPWTRMFCNKQKYFIVGPTVNFWIGWQLSKLYHPLWLCL
jgi:hypothetical protein